VVSPGAGSDAVEYRALQRQSDPRPVARLAVGAEGPAVTQRREAAERERQHPAKVSAARVCHEPDPARIVLELRVVEGTDRGESMWRHPRLR
jgi:hypothetical protein